MYRYNRTGIILKISIILLLTTSLTIKCSCQRSNEPKTENTGYITYTLRWDSVIPGFPVPEKLRYCVYSSEGGPMIQTDGDAKGITLFLPPDKYNVLIFNYDAKNIEFRNMSKFEEAEAYISSTANEKVCQDEAIPFYVASIRSEEIKVDMKNHKELILSPVLLSKDTSLNLSSNKKKVANSINKLKKTSIQ
ncbi:MAG: DUF5119 domain-containing protein [Parabacteroides sp.]|nr:DUF5119 domain-containing protein [Parabacteroides sp.]